MSNVPLRPYSAISVSSLHLSTWTWLREKERERGETVGLEPRPQHTDFNTTQPIRERREGEGRWVGRGEGRGQGRGQGEAVGREPRPQHTDFNTAQPIRERREGEGRWVGRGEGRGQGRGQGEAVGREPRPQHTDFNTAQPTRERRGRGEMSEERRGERTGRSCGPEALTPTHRLQHCPANKGEAEGRRQGEVWGCRQDLEKTVNINCVPARGLQRPKRF